MKKGGLHPQHQPHQSEEKRGRCGRSSPSTAPAESEIQTEGKTWLGLYFLIQLSKTFGAVFNLSQRLLLFSHFRLFSCFFSCHFICHSPSAKLPSGCSHLSHSLISTPVPHSLISYIHYTSPLSPVSCRIVLLVLIPACLLLTWACSRFCLWLLQSSALYHVKTNDSF